MQAATVWRQGWLLAGVAGLLVLSGAARADAVHDWLNRAAAAAKQLNYSGIYVYHQSEHVEVLRVLHRIDAAGEQEKVEVLDGAPRQFLRINNDVYCHLQDGKSVRLERNTARRFFPALLPVEPASLLDYYDAKLGATERVAGRPCQVVTLEPRDGYRYGFTLWLDKQTGLPLKSHIVNGHGSVVSMFVFSEIQIGKAPDIQLFRNDLKGKRIQNASLDIPADVDWSVTPPPGFAQVQKAVRPLPGKTMPVTHLVFSDGLSVLSLFVEPADPKVQRLRGLSAEGAIGAYGREVDGYTVTTMGEVPNLALIETGNSVQRK
ncbi:MAG: MucB/RseB C-terminal domain-containing protein [Gammaproteobacteria bacterium]|jgi:sigma-E factor negative regulatory protein RseB|nr:MucB/RseB C-terminal domain-containing protein [Gammaproteobacteria bacterium]MBU1408916.1 MucB/RseB C-terminal domain-containing protein [Gammaproteobacteria bacterium]MBU1533663.1 MucB/RseB C-terminal domain-containing protein [Gammaproteobacteria bacterium]